MSLWAVLRSDSLLWGETRSGNTTPTSTAILPRYIDSPPHQISAEGLADCVRITKLRQRGTRREMWPTGFWVSTRILWEGVMLGSMKVE